MTRAAAATTTRAGGARRDDEDDAGAAPGASSSASGAASPSYLHRSARPLESLVFLLPFIVIYELGTRLLLTDPVHGTRHIVAFTMLQQFFAFVGATNARHLPALAVAAILLAWHVARKDDWRVRPATLGGMVLESAAWAFPLIVFGLLLARLFPLAASTRGEDGGWLDEMILRVGAGIYEELVFRLILCTLLALLLRNLLRVEPGPALLLLVVISGILFSAYHYLGNESFQWRNFVFRAGAGAYFSLLFVLRGFGITAGCHIAYDILIILL